MVNFINYADNLQICTRKRLEFRKTLFRDTLKK